MRTISDVTNFVIVRSKQDTDAVVRLQSNPILFGLRNLPDVNCYVYDPTSSTDRLTPDQPTCIILHYNDANAINAVRALQRNTDLLIICLGSDVYTYDKYTAIHDLVDLYVMPTELHRRILTSRVSKPVFVLPECIDPIALGKHQREHPGCNQACPDAVPEFPTRHGRNVCWFGYAESFDKGMSSLVPVIKLCLTNEYIDSFDIILNQGEFVNRSGLNTIQFDLETFPAIAERYDYTICSHFSLDLALNSYIKSPNKAITGLFSGIIPLASDTPNYHELFEMYGLREFLFDSPLTLYAKFQNLDPMRDSRVIQNSGVIPRLRADLSNDRLIANFLTILKQHQWPDNERARSLFAPIIPMPSPETTFREHLSDLIPSFIRGVRARLRSCSLTVSLARWISARRRHLF